MADFAGWDFHSDDEEENEYTNLSRTALVVIISCSPDMFRVWECNPDKPIVAALKCCHSMWRTKVISSPKDKVAILLMGTEHAKNSSDFPNLFVLQEMSSIKAKMINDIQKMIVDPTDLNGFEDNIGVSSDYDLRNTFWQAKLMFEEGDTKNMSKKIMLFTCEDNPHEDNANLQQDAIQKIKDLGNVDFSIATFYPDFDYNKFYSKILPDESSVIQAKDCESLLKVIRIKQRLKRPLTRSTMEITPGIRFAVGLYSLIRKAPNPKAVKVNAANELLDKKVNLFDKETGLPILKAEVNKAVYIGGEKAVFTPSEIKDLKYNFNAGIFLVGFLDESHMDPFAWFRSPGYFIYPDDDKIKGSKDLFISLLKRCSALKKIALVRFVMTRGRNAKLGCLVPSLGPKCKFGPEFPQGFHLVVLPFADEIRHHDVDVESEASDEMIESLEKIVKKLTQKNFSVADIQNPVLYHKWRSIEGAALNLTDDETFLDLSQPNLELMEERAGDLMTDFNTAVQNAGYSLNSTSSTTKASKAKVPRTPSTNDKASAKKTKYVDIENEWRHKRLESLTVATLKDFIYSKKIFVQGRYSNPKFLSKIDYIQAVSGYFEGKK